MVTPQARARKKAGLKFKVSSLRFKVGSSSLKHGLEDAAPGFRLSTGNLTRNSKLET
jgi:hypothetical protein